ncbi:unnamed protein product [Orchesella dallaii]|uniref:PEHE domain-containing protein n=1 Tax=Orchesella dallaii TaxID=48710 RepID=A0ABP1PRS9_9HEXA
MDSCRNRRGRVQLPVCAFQFPDQLLKMKNSEEFRKEVTASTSSATEIPEPNPALKPPDPVSSELGSNSEEAMDISAALDAAAIDDSSGVVELKMETSEENKAEKQTATVQPSAIASTSQEHGQAVTQEQLKKPEELPSTSTMTPNVSTPGSASVSNNGTSVNSVNEDDDAMTIDSSSDEDEEDVYVNRFPRDNMGPDNNEPIEEVILKRNSEYLAKRCSSLMQRVQGIMQSATARHVSRQLQAVVEHPGFNPLLRSKSNSYQDIIPPSQRITKQNIAELQFSGKLMTNIIRHSMGRSFDINDDSATEESETDDDEVVLPDDRTTELSNSDYSPYLPVENNPFIDAVKLEKQYEAKRTSLEFSINECDYSLTKSLALRKHCKARKPCFQLEKPSTSTSSNVINIPVDATSSVKLYHDCKPATFKRVSDMIQRRSSLEDGPKPNGEISTSSSSNSMLKTTSSSGVDQSTGLKMLQGTSSSSSSSQMDCSSQEGNASSGGTVGNSFMPTIKTLGTDGLSVLGVEFFKSSDPTQSASRCAAIKRPDKNRKVFQLGGIQNIFRDPARLPTVLCSCYGRDELCALCLGRAKKKIEINHVYMNSRDKLTVLDETFHKTLSFPEDVPLEALLTPISIGGASFSSIVPSGDRIQQYVRNRSHKFPPDFLDTGPRPKKPRSYDIKPYVESPVRSPKKDNRYDDDTPHSPRKRSAPRKSQSTYEDRDILDFAGKGLGLSRERKDSIRRTRNQEFDIDNIVIPYSMAATTRVEQLVYKPIETPSWRILEYSDIFTSGNDKSDGELEDMSTATFIHRHNKCEVEERKRFSQALQKAKNSNSRKTRRLDSTCKSDSFDATHVTGDETPSQSQTQASEKVEKGKESTDGSTTPQLTDNATVITEAMANQALKSLFKVGRRRTISTTSKMEEEEEPAAVVNFVDPWPERSYPIPEVDYKEMVDEMHKCFPDCPVGLTSHDSHSVGSSSPTVF